jgi:hypothetical protein
MIAMSFLTPMLHEVELDKVLHPAPSFNPRLQQK